MQEELAEKVGDWIPVLRDMVSYTIKTAEEAKPGSTKKGMTFGQQIDHFCSLHGLGYPPPEIKRILLRISAASAVALGYYGSKESV